MSKSAIVEILGLGCLFILLVSCVGGGADLPEPVKPNPETEVGRAIVFGDISDDPAEVIEGTQPLADYLASDFWAWIKID